MQRSRLTAALSCIVATAALIALFSGISSGGAFARTVVEPHGQIDVELAFDTTASMTHTIDQAKRDGATIVARVRDAFPETRFAVVSFRDYGNAHGDYEVVQPMTEDLGALQAAFLELRPEHNSSAFNTAAEEYNLLFQKSYTDAALDWRSQARKVVVVLGDAQPHGAGAGGIAGCTDTSIDNYGLNTAGVLAGMRAAERTLVMIRQVSNETTASLSCYEAMAERAYVGGAARNGGDTDLAGSILDLIQNALAPVTLRPDVGVAVRGGSAGYTATVSNPNSFALSLRSLAIKLPAGFRHHSGASTAVMSSDASPPTKVSWPTERVLRPSEQVSIHFRSNATKRRGRYRAHAVGRLQLPGGNVIAASGRATLRVTARLQSLAVAARAQRPLGRSGAVSLRGGVRIAFRPGIRKHRAGKLQAGRFVIRSGPGRSLALRVRSYRLVSFGSPTILRLGVKVESVRGMRGCSPQARGSALIIDNQGFNAKGLRRDAITIAFSAKCRIATGRWLNVNAGADRTAVAVTAR